jgi:hypothetical protein
LINGLILPVLEPNFDLALCEAELVGHLDAAAPGEVVVRVELLLQLQGLVPAVMFIINPYTHCVIAHNQSHGMSLK